MTISSRSSRHYYFVVTRKTLTMTPTTMAFPKSLTAWKTLMATTMILLLSLISNHDCHAQQASPSMMQQRQLQEEFLEQIPPPEQQEQQEQQQELAPNTSLQQQENPCGIQIPPLEIEVPGTFTASYPGSGAKLTWKLIRAISGIYTGDDHDHNGRVSAHTAVAIKTHFPAAGPAEVFFDEKLAHIQRAILLIRNPMSALPSYHNFQYEQENGLLNHSTRAPVEVWIQWRNAHFEEEIDNWVNHAKFWLERFHKEPSKLLFLLPYEYLTAKDHPEMGIHTLKRLGQFLEQGDEVILNNMIEPDMYSCVWENFVVNKYVPGEKERRSSLRSGGPVTYPYTPEQIEYMIQSLLRVRDEYADVHQEFYELMQQYLGQLVQKKNEVEGKGVK